MNSFLTKEPEYIEESDEILLLRQIYTPDSLFLQHGAWNMGFILLTQTLFLLYEHTLFSHLVSRSHIISESQLFSQHMLTVTQTNQWAKSTSSIALNSLKKILNKTNINTNFIKQLNLRFEKKIKKLSPAFCLPHHYKHLDDNNPDKILLIHWICKLKNQTKYKSQASIRMVIAFVVHFLEYNNISPFSNYPNINKLSFEDIKKSIHDIQPDHPLRKKIQYISVFICMILGYTSLFNNFETFKKTIPIPVKKSQSETDQHRLSTIELEKMYISSKNNIRDHTLFLLMISTGLRAGGVSNIKLDHISSTINDVLTINKTGRTIEKGNKWFTFIITDELSKIIYEYITTTRIANSSYLFPGRGEDIGLSSSRINALIKKIAKDADIHGPHIHAHSLRHSFAHILLESGNRPELVSKMLGHSSTQTTEQYYLKESAVEASKRMNIPWLEKQDTISPIPNFLNKKVKTTKSERNKTLKRIAEEFKKK
jgi:integrase